MTLREFLVRCRKMIDEYPECLDMVMVAVDGASGATHEVGHPHVEEVSSWDGAECPVEHLLPKNYPFEDVVEVYIGN